MRGDWLLNRQGLLAAILLLIPVAGSAVASIGGTQLRPVRNIPQRGALAFHQYLVALEPSRATEEVFARFGFSNMGTEPVVIEQIIPSCGCLQPQLKQKVYPPDSTGDFVVRVKTANEAAGLREYTLKVKYRDPQPREEVVVFRVKLPAEQITIRPRALTFYQLSGVETTQEVVITDPRTPALTPLHVLCSTDKVKAALGETTINSQGYTCHHLKITVAGKVPAQKFHARVTVATDDLTFRNITIPLTIYGSGNAAVASRHENEKHPLVGPPSPR